MGPGYRRRAALPAADARVGRRRRTARARARGPERRRLATAVGPWTRSGGARRARAGRRRGDLTRDPPGRCRSVRPGGWPEVATHRAAVLALGLCDEDWLDACLPALTESAHAAPLEGDRLLHMDVRSDNLCLREDGARFVDWNFACRGNPRFDVASWLPSLEAEGGPPPKQVVPPAPDMAAFAAMLAGYFASHAARAPIPEAPHVRGLQLMQARTALLWAARALGLPPPEPPRAPHRDA
ncbi:MAG: phosphotransferase family protein [Actinomycetota bacterium]